MKKSSFLALAVAPMILGAPLATQAQSVSTDPVGFVKLTLEPGLQSVGAAMLHPAVAAGLVASSDASSITLDGTHSIESVLTSGTAYYVEVASGATWEGERFEVNVDGSTGSTLAISPSSRNTVDLSAADLSGHSVRVRPHRTLGEVFDVAALQAGGNAGSADNVLLFNSATGGFDTYFLQSDPFGGSPVWRQVGVSGNFNNLVLEPGLGMFFQRTGAEVVELVTNIGEVRTNNFRQPFAAGLTLISEGHPLDNSPASRMMTPDNGFTAGGNAGSADNIMVFNAATGGFVTYFLQSDPFGGAPTWRQVGGSGNFNEVALMAADAAVFVLKQSADPQYEAPKNF